MQAFPQGVILRVECKLSTGLAGQGSSAGREGCRGVWGEGKGRVAEFFRPFPSLIPPSGRKPVLVVRLFSTGSFKGAGLGGSPSPCPSGLVFIYALNGNFICVHNLGFEFLTLIFAFFVRAVVGGCGWLWAVVGGWLLVGLLGFDVVFDLNLSLFCPPSCQSSDFYL